MGLKQNFPFRWQNKINLKFFQRIKPDKSLSKEEFCKIVQIILKNNQIENYEN